MNRIITIVKDPRYDSGEYPFPPVGSTGTIIIGEDSDGDYEVVFDNYPNISDDDPGWFIHKTMFVYIDQYDKDVYNQFKQPCHTDQKIKCNSRLHYYGTQIK